MADFYDKIKYFEREIHNLKTAHVKTSTTIATLEKITSIELSLRLYGSAASYWEINSSKKAVVTLTSTDGTDMINALYVDGITADNFNDRYIFVRRRASTAGKSIFEIYVYSYNTNDRDILEGGGSVVLNYNLTAVGSSNYNLSVTYEDNPQWQ